MWYKDNLFFLSLFFVERKALRLRSKFDASERKRWQSFVLASQTFPYQAREYVLFRNAY